MMSIKYECDAGQVIEFTPEEVTPLTFDDLLRTKNFDMNSYPVKFQTNNLVIDGARKPGSHVARTPIAFKESLNIYALVQGGWLPPPLVLSKHLLVDRNVVSRLKQIRSGAQRADFTGFDWWLQFFADGLLVFNPVLFAFEGNSKKTPSYEEFVQGYDEATAELKSAFPSATVVSYQEIHYQAAYKILRSVENRLQQESLFLIETMPLVAQPVAEANLRKNESAIFNAAIKNGVKPNSIALIATLSCLYENRGEEGKSVGRDILKPKPRFKYGHEHAYNALADIRNLEIFIASNSLQNSAPFSLLTCDKALALLWCGLSPIALKDSLSVVKYSLSPNRKLFPRLSENDFLRLMSHLNQLS